MKKLILHIVSVLALLLALLMVFWFHNSSASRKTVTSDGETPKKPSVQTDNQTPSRPNTPSTPSLGGNDKPIEPPEPDAWQSFLASLQTKGDEDIPVWQYGENVGLVLENQLSLTMAPSFVDSARVYFTFSEDGTPIFEIGNEKVPALSLYGGLLLYRNESQTQILDPHSGNVLANIDGYYPVYAQNDDKQPLFYRYGQFYIWDTDKGEMVMVPSFACHPYGAASVDYTLIPYYDTAKGLWGYQNAKGEAVIEARYYRAFPFSENGIAAVQTSKTGGVLFIDKEAKVVLDSRLKQYTYNGNLVYDLYVIAEPLTEQSAEQLFFSKGYVRVCAMTYAINNTTEVLRTRWLLVDLEGNALSMPEDYTVRAYSDGVAVLEKNGKYGYYSYKGHWITKPIYTQAEAFSGGIGVVLDENGCYRAFDDEGNEMIPPVFDDLLAPSNGKILGYREDTGWMLFSLCEKKP